MKNLVKNLGNLGTLGNLGSLGNMGTLGSGKFGNTRKFTYAQKSGKTRKSKNLNLIQS